MSCVAPYPITLTLVLTTLRPSELLNFPDELRSVLEECLSEEASTATLDRYLPLVRSIVTSLLKLLRGKQHTFRQLVNSRPKSDVSGHNRSDSGQTSRSSRTHVRRDTQASISSTDDSSSRRNTQSSVGSSRRKESYTYDPAPNGENGFVGGFTFPMPVPQPHVAQSPNNSDRPSQHLSDPRPPSAPAPPFTPPPHNAALPESEIDSEGTPVPPPKSSVPASIKRYSLVDKPILPPAVVVDDTTSQSPTEPDRSSTHSPPPELPAVDSLANPGVASSLAALKKSDLLERRASKRFSTYNISKMTGAPRGRADMGNGHPNRRSLVAGGGGPLTAKELSVLTEADEEDAAPVPVAPPPRRQRSLSRTRGPPPPDVAEERPPVPSIPRAPATPQPQPQPPVPTTPAESSGHATPAPKPAPDTPESMTVFLQVGREVKKAKMEPGLTFSSLRMIFVDKFAYNPGQEDFPAIYIRDPSSGVQYELEDTDEVKDKCLLSLNIEREYLSWRIYHAQSTNGIYFSAGSDQEAYRRANLQPCAGTPRSSQDSRREPSSIVRRRATCDRRKQRSRSAY